MLLFFLGSQFSRLLRVTFSVFMFAAILSGCGGGGSSSGTPDTIANPAPDVAPVPTAFSISGTIQIPAGSLADKDTLPASSKLVPVNNAPDSAQEITNPSSVGGYVSSRDGVYVGKPIIYDEDQSDIYSVSLLNNQVVTLRAFPADPAINAPAEQTTLKLVRKSDNQTDVVTDTNDKALTVTGDGDYFIHVIADDGPVLYLLTISQGLVSTGLSASISSDFVPGEVMVKLKSSNAEFSAQGLMANPEQRRGQLNDHAKLALESIDGLTHKGGSADHGMRMGIDIEKYRAFSAQTTDLSGWPEKTQRKWETLQFIESLKQRDDIEWAEPNYIRKAMFTPSDPLYSAQWHYPLINLPAAWDVSTGSSVVVAVIDTGIASTHTDLAANLFADGYDFISSVAVAGDGDGLDDNPEDNGSTFHGSHVAGTIAASTNSVGGVGVAFNSKIMPLRALGIDGSGNDSDIAEAILYAAQEANTSPEIPSQMAAVINLSLGGPGFSNSLKSAIDTAVSKGVIIIAAAGNENTSVPSYPAAFSNVISVSAVGQTKELAPYSNFGSTISVAAPGGNMQEDANGDGNVDGILSTVNASSYAWFQGTSMAAPHVAGVAALMKSAKPALNATEFNSLLVSGMITDDLGATGRDDQYGYGLINAAKAMTALNETIAPFLAVNPQSISFDSLEVSSQLTLAMGGGGTVKVTSIVDDADWLSVVTSSNVDSNNLGTYIVNIDRGGKDIGSSHVATITVNYQIDSVNQTAKTISVLMIVPDPSKVATVGTLLVGLIERAAQEDAEKALENGDENILIDIFKLQEATENQGVYSYSFTDIPLGDYYVFASTNMDQDGIVSDAGEAMGDYPVVGEPTLVKVTDADLSGLNFTVGYLNVVEGLSVDSNAKAKIIRKIPGGFLPENRVNKSQSIQKQN